MVDPTWHETSVESWSQRWPRDVCSLLQLSLYYVLYRAETWILTANQEGALDGVYTWMLRRPLMCTGKTKCPTPSSTLPYKDYLSRSGNERMRLAGHCVRHPESAVSPLVLWEPIDGNRSKGRRRLITFVDQLKKDARQQETTERRTLMLDQDAWKTTIRVSREGVGWRHPLAQLMAPLQIKQIGLTCFILNILTSLI